MPDSSAGPEATIAPRLMDAPNSTIEKPADKALAVATAGRPAPPATMVIFGAAGDLTKRLVIPALYNLAHTGVLPEKFALIGVDRAEGTADSTAFSPAALARA